MSIFAVVSDHGATPENEETARMSKLIGKRLTLIEVRENGEIYLEFNPHGSITISLKVQQEILTSVVSEGVSYRISQ
jgi:hypothetical protein